MRIYNGYPTEIKIDGAELTVHDVNRMLLSLMWDKDLNEPDKSWLSDIYRQERQRYLDEQYEMTEDNRKALQTIEQKLTDEIQACQMRMKRMKQRELEKKRQGIRPARRIQLHLEIANFSSEDNVFYTEEEVDVWNLIFSEDPLDPFWGMVRYSTDMNEKEDDDILYFPKIGMTEKGNMFQELEWLKKNYTASWQDIQKIKDFKLTIYFDY